MSQFSIDDIARVCHEANRGLQVAAGEEGISPSWGKAPDWQKDPARAGVRFAIENETTPEAQHEAWCHSKVADGWVYGPVKDGDAKTHPCLVPYGDLPDFQKLKDRVFVAIVGALT